MIVAGRVAVTILDPMPFNLGKPLWRACRRRLCAGVTLMAYLAAAIGFPMPATSAQEPGACGQRVCCCGTPAQCKANGCGCSHDGTESEDEPSPDCCKKPAKPNSKNNVRWVVGIAAVKCGGGPMQWLSGDAALPTAPPLTWQPSSPFCHSLPITHEFPFAIATDLLDPPPRLDAI
jgi:hypothetical protein